MNEKDEKNVRAANIDKNGMSTSVLRAHALYSGEFPIIRL